MIANIKIGKSFAGALEYNMNKLTSANQSERAELLETNFSSVNTTSIVKEVAMLEEMNPKLMRTTFHTSLNFAKEENVSNEKMLNIAKEYMQKMGFNDNLYLIIRHHDADHPHCHILAHRTRLDGSTVSDSNSYHMSNQILRDLEVKYKVNQVNSIYESQSKNISKNEIEFTLRTGQATAKMQLESVIMESLERAPNMVDFFTRLEKHGVLAHIKQNHEGKATGLVFITKEGQFISGSKMHRDFSLPNLLKRYNLVNHPRLQDFAVYINRKSNSLLHEKTLSKGKISKDDAPKQHIRNIVNESIAKSKNLTTFASAIGKQGVACHFSLAKTGRVTGLQFICKGKSYKVSEVDRKLSSAKILKALNYDQETDLKVIKTINTQSRQLLAHVTAPGSNNNRENVIKSNSFMSSSKALSSPLMQDHAVNNQFSFIKKELEKAKDILHFVNKLNKHGVQIYFKPNGSNTHEELLLIDKNKRVIPGNIVDEKLSTEKLFKHFGLKDHPKLPKFKDYINQRTSKLLSIPREEFAKLIPDNKQSIRLTLNNIMRLAINKSESLDDMIKFLEKKQVYCKFNLAKNNHLTGLSVVYKGIAYKSSDIHRDLSINKILKTLRYEQTRDSAAVSQANNRTREKFGNEIPRGYLSPVRHLGEKSKSTSPDVHKRNGSFVSTERHTLSKSESPGKSIQSVSAKPEVAEKAISDTISSIARLFNNGPTKDGLNTQRNNRKRKNRPSL